jgi:triosephosphate isomerase
MTTPRPLVAGNWKMNGLKTSAAQIKELNQLASSGGANCDLLICPPATLISTLVRAGEGGVVAIGGQDCHANGSGAHTGDISAEMLKDLGCTYVIVGHSERRADHGETSADVLAKARAVQGQGLKAIICCGETNEEREAGKTLDVVLGQISLSVPEDALVSNTVIAYEPVWAIGTGKVPTAGDVKTVHAAIREVLIKRFGAGGASIGILYGGSVKASNASELMSVENVNGALVGGASLKATDFYGIVEAYK